MTAAHSYWVINACNKKKNELENLPIERMTSKRGREKTITLLDNVYLNSIMILIVNGLQLLEFTRYHIPDKICLVCCVHLQHLIHSNHHQIYTIHHQI